MMPEEKFIIKTDERSESHFRMRAFDVPFGSLDYPGYAYEYCLKAFEGDYREVFVVEFENKAGRLCHHANTGNF